MRDGTNDLAGWALWVCFRLDLVKNMNFVSRTRVHMLVSEC